MTKDRQGILLGETAAGGTWALELYSRVETIGFDYGQRHAVELACREKIRAGIAAMKPAWGERLGADHMIDASVLKSLGETAMTHEVEIASTAAGLPSNLLNSTT